MSVKKGFAARHLPFVAAIVETVEESGPRGMPNGPCYAAVMGSLSLDEYQGILEFLRSESAIEFTDSWIKPGPRCAELVGLLNRVLAKLAAVSA